MKKLLAVIVILLVSLSGFTQVMVDVDIKMVDFATRKKLSGSMVTVYDGTKVVNSSNAGSNGNVKFSIPAGKKYKMVFSKEGKVNRFLRLDASEINASSLGGAKSATMEIEVSLFDEVPNIDYSYVENNPITEFYFESDPKLVFDDIIAARMAKKIEALMAEMDKKLGQNEAMYQKAIELADDWFKKKKYDLALAKYEEATMLKSKEPYPKEQINRLDALMKAEKQNALIDKQNDELYKKTVEAANSLRDQKKYKEALAKYEEAAKIKDELFVKEQISSINKTIADEKAAAELDAKYNASVAAGDQLFNQKKYEEAKVKYSEASGLKPAEAHPKQRLNEINAKLKEAEGDAARKKQYEDKITTADRLFGEDKLTEAKTVYNQALGIDNTQAYPKKKIQEIDAKVAEMAKNKAKIDGLLKEGLALYGKKDLKNAQTKYEEVLRLDNSNSEAKSKLAAIEKALLEQQSEAQKEEQFKKLKAEGIALKNKSDWEEARAKLEEAKRIKPDPEVIQHLKEIQDNLAKEQAYKKILQQAEGLQAANNIDGSIAKYEEALKIKPSDVAVKEKIADLKKIKAAGDNQAEKDKLYNEAMKNGNAAFVAKNYTQAIKYYNDAGSVKPSEKDPKEKAAEAERLEKAKSEKQEDQAYAKILLAGQEAIDTKNWTKARDMYTRAVKLRPDDKTPKNKLEEIESLEKAEAGSELTEAEYKNKLAQAETAASQKEYDKAISLFNEAARLKPKEVVPPARIKELSLLKAQEMKGEKSEELYNEYMNKGNQAVISKQYTDALSQYQNALTVKENDRAALSKIDQVQKLIDEEKNNLGAQKLKEEFDALIKMGDQLFQDENWIEARKNYEQALDLIPTDLYARRQVDKCIRGLKQTPDELKQYRKLIAAADEYFNSGNYTKAEELYQRALTFKAKDNYPQKKLDEIKRILNPVVIQAPDSLPSLGIQTYDDPKEVQAKLEQAELERKNRERLKLATKGNKIEDNNGQTAQDNKDEILATRTELEAIEKKNALKYDRSDENRQAYVEKTKEVTTDASDNMTKTGTMNYNESLNTKELFLNISTENSALYVESDKVYQENSASVKVYNNQIQESVVQTNLAAYSANIEGQQHLNRVAVKHSEEVMDDFESRKEIEGAVNQTVKSIAKDENLSIDKNNESVSATNAVLDNEAKKRAIKFEKDSEVSGTNKEELKRIENNIQASDVSAIERNNQTSLTADNLLSAKQKDQGKLITEQEQNRILNSENLKAGADGIQNKDYQNFQDNLEQSLTNQEELAAEKRKGDVRYGIEKENFDEIVSELGAVDKKSASRNAEFNQSDEQERLNMTAGVSDVQGKVMTKYSDDSKNKENTVEAVKLVTTVMGDQTMNNNLDQQDKLTETRLSLDHISSKKIEFTDRVANEIGALYPEGVSQETFNVTDENGLLVSVVTRRVVVKKGYGQVYVRTQSLTGITYSKNGSPSSEYTWQRETSDASLVKNY